MVTKVITIFFFFSDIILVKYMYLQSYQELQASSRKPRLYPLIFQPHKILLFRDVAQQHEKCETFSVILQSSE